MTDTTGIRLPAREGLDWDLLTSDERLGLVLCAVADLGERGHDATGNAIAAELSRRGYRFPAAWGNHGRGNVQRRMADAVRVTPAITALRRRGLIDFGSRSDGLSGTADDVTRAGEALVRELRS